MCGDAQPCVVMSGGGCGGGDDFDVSVDDEEDNRVRVKMCSSG